LKDPHQGNSLKEQRGVRGGGFERKTADLGGSVKSARATISRKAPEKERSPPGKRLAKKRDSEHDLGIVWAEVKHVAGTIR